jgi:hypothetical protein
LFDRPKTTAGVEEEEEEDGWKRHPKHVEGYCSKIK